MALYSISYTRPGEGVFEHRMTAKSDSEARMRFLNLSWVAFTAISVNSIALAADQPEADKEAARQASSRKVANVKSAPVVKLPKAKPVDPHSLKPYEPPPPPPPTVASLSDEIARLQDKRAKALGRNDHYSANALSERINECKRQRHELLKTGATK